MMQWCVLMAETDTEEGGDLGHDPPSPPGLAAYSDEAHDTCP